MLYPAQHSPQCDDSLFAYKNQEHYNQSLAKSQLNLPDFDESQVIAINQPIDIRFEEEKPFQRFFMRMNELGYETNHITNQTIIVTEDHSVKQSFFQEGGNANKNFLHATRKTSHQFGEKEYRKKLGKALQKMTEKVFELDYERIQILDYIEDVKAQMYAQARKYLIIWEELLVTVKKSFEAVHVVQSGKIAKLEEEIEVQTSRIEELQFSKQNVNQEELKWKERVDELEEEIRKLNLQTAQLQAQNEELRYEIRKLNEYEEKIHSYQEEINNLNRNLQQNSEYVFDLQQRVENYNYEMIEKEKKILIEHEIEIQETKERIQQHYSSQFEKVQEDIRQKVMDQLCHQYHSYTIEIEQLKRQLQDQSNFFQGEKEKYECELHILSQEKMNLIEQNREYEIKLHEMEQLQMKIKVKTKQEDRYRHELQSKLRETEQRYREREAQLNYYKSIRNRPIDQSRAVEPNPNFRHKRSTNILIMEDSILDKSILKESAISPSSAIQQKFGKSREDLINNILSRIKLRQQGSNISQLLENSYEESQMKKTLPSTLRPHSPQSVMLEKQKDVRMKNISNKLQQLRSDIRRQIGMMKN